MIAQEYPELWQGWVEKLEEWQKSAGLPEEWITDGKWRLKEEGKDDADSHY
jgi:hypothetical protein